MASWTNIAFWFMLVALLTSGGCRAHQLRHDQDQMRDALLDLYTNQLMDNLIRAENGYPIVQLDYSRATGTISQTGNAGVGGSQTVTNVRPVVSRTIATLFNYTIGAQQQNQLTVTAEPVLNNNEVYNAYLEFLKADPDRGDRLIVSCEPPPCGAAHISRQCGDRYYWVPAEFKHDFLRLALVTTVQRGQPLKAPDYFEATVKEANIPPKPDPVNPTPEQEDGVGRLRLVLSKKIPNDSGKATFRFGDGKIVFKLFPVNDTPLGEPTKELWLQIKPLESVAIQVPAAPGELKVLLTDEPVRITLSSNFPGLPTTENLIDDLRSELELIRLQQFNR